MFIFERAVGCLVDPHKLQITRAGGARGFGGLGGSGGAGRSPGIRIFSRHFGHSWTVPHNLSSNRRTTPQMGHLKVTGNMGAHPNYLAVAGQKPSSPRSFSRAISTAPRLVRFVAAMKASRHAERSPSISIASLAVPRLSKPLGEASVVFCTFLAMSRILASSPVQVNTASIRRQLHVTEC